MEGSEKPEEESEVAANHEKWPSWEGIPEEESDEEAGPGQALPHEELEPMDRGRSGSTGRSARAKVPYPPKGVYKPLRR